jgi:hypothetical protein
MQRPCQLAKNFQFLIVFQYDKVTGVKHLTVISSTRVTILVTPLP